MTTKSWLIQYKLLTTVACNQFQCWIDSEDLSASLMKCSQQCREAEDHVPSIWPSLMMKQIIILIPLLSFWPLKYMHTSWQSTQVAASSSTVAPASHVLLNWWSLVVYTYTCMHKDWYLLWCNLIGHVVHVLTTQLFLIQNRPFQYVAMLYCEVWYTGSSMHVLCKWHVGSFLYITAVLNSGMDLMSVIRFRIYSSCLWALSHICLIANVK